MPNIPDFWYHAPLSETKGYKSPQRKPIQWHYTNEAFHIKAAHRWFTLTRQTDDKAAYDEKDVNAGIAHGYLFLDVKHVRRMANDYKG